MTNMVANFTRPSSSSAETLSVTAPVENTGVPESPRKKRNFGCSGSYEETFNKEGVKYESGCTI